MILMNLFFIFYCNIIFSFFFFFSSRRRHTRCGRDWSSDVCSYDLEARGCVCPPQIPQCVCGRQPRLRLITRKPLAPSADEIQDNPRSRSARLRVAEKLSSEE